MEKELKSWRFLKNDKIILESEGIDKEEFNDVLYKYLNENYDKSEQAELLNKNEHKIREYEYDINDCETDWYNPTEYRYFRWVLFMLLELAQTQMKQFSKRYKEIGDKIWKMENGEK